MAGAHGEPRAVHVPAHARGFERDQDHRIAVDRAEAADLGGSDRGADLGWTARVADLARRNGGGDRSA
jgi:hypothetical protein